MNTVNERWREPILDVHTDEAYVIDSDAERRRGLKHIFSGKERFDNIGRVLQGLACANCLTPLPARPGLDSVHLYRQGQMNYIGLRSEQEALALVAQGKCPICAHEVSTTMADVGFMGTMDSMGNATKK